MDYLGDVVVLASCFSCIGIIDLSYGRDTGRT